jgi:hypothetical protein
MKDFHIVLDGKRVGWCNGKSLIVAQTQTGTYRCPVAGTGVPLTPDVKAIQIEFELDYDTIPATGIRRSYRKMEYQVNFANGKTQPPLLDQHSILSEWER